MLLAVTLTGRLNQSAGNIYPMDIRNWYISRIVVFVEKKKWLLNIYQHKLRIVLIILPDFELLTIQIVSSTGTGARKRKESC